MEEMNNFRRKKKRIFVSNKEMVEVNIVNRLDRSTTEKKLVIQYLKQRNILCNKTLHKESLF